MIYISHRGNLNGPNPDRENSPDYILEALARGFDVECDVWLAEGRWYLGHDDPLYEVTKDFLSMPRLWLHCKDIKALAMMTRYFQKQPQYFWHQEDDFTLTSRGLIWTYPGKEISTMSIAVKPESVPDWDVSLAAGICSDFVANWKSKRA